MWVDGWVGGLAGGREPLRGGLPLALSSTHLWPGSTYRALCAFRQLANLHRIPQKGHGSVLDIRRLRPVICESRGGQTEGRGAERARDLVAACEVADATREWSWFGGEVRRCCRPASRVRRTYPYHRRPPTATATRTAIDARPSGPANDALFGPSSSFADPTKAEGSCRRPSRMPTVSVK